MSRRNLQNSQRDPTGSPRQYKQSVAKYLWKKDWKDEGATDDESGETEHDELSCYLTTQLTCCDIR